MDRKSHRRSTLAVQSTASQSHPASYYPASAIPNRSTSLRHSTTNKSEPPLPASLSRVKGRIAMNTPPSEMSWLKDQSPTPGTPGTPREIRTPEPGTTSLVNPSSALLQDLLKEQRASRGSRATTSEDCDDFNPRTPDRAHSRSHSQSLSQSQEDTASERRRKINSALSAGLKQPREMGFREMDLYVSKINKQNFDLKLEIFHRVQQVSTFERKLERMEELEEEVERLQGVDEELQELRDAEEDNQRLRESNEELRRELDKRDQAVTEAVELICQLEARIEELEMGGSFSRPSTARPDDASERATTPKPPIVDISEGDIPERTSSYRGTSVVQHRRVSSDSQHLKRTPSFLRDENKSTAALRSLYNDEPRRPALSIMTKTESLNSMNDATETESPRLSALSECSELVPLESYDQEDSFDQLDIPVRRTNLPTENSAISELNGEEEASKRHTIHQWVPPQPQLSPELEKRRKRASMDSSMVLEKPSVENDLYHNASQKTRLRQDGIFGSSRLPPTPDTMSTAYALGKNGSDESIATEKGQNYGRRLARPRSLDELTTRRSSANSRLSDSVDTNVSESTRSQFSRDEKDDDTAIFPLNAITSGQGFLGDRSAEKVGFGYYGGGTMLNGEAIQKVLNKMDGDYYSPAIARDGSSSPPLTPQDWMEAAKSKPRSKKERARKLNDNNVKLRAGPSPVNARLVGARAPSQSSFLARRHSIDSTVRDPEVPTVPTLDLSSLEPIRQPSPEPEKRRLSLLPPLFSRVIGNSRRLQPSPIPDGDSEEGAPSPVIRKTRQAPKPSASGLSGLTSPTPTYAQANAENPPKTLPHSFTESNLWSQGTGPRPTTSHSNNKEHKRRGSLGIFGWMKSSTSKKADSNHLSPPTQPNGILKEKTVNYMAFDGAGGDNVPITMNTNAESFASNSKHTSRIDEEDQGRRPRYMERRSRRV